MRIIRVLSHGLFLFVANLAGIVAGFLAWRLIGGTGQLVAQIPIGVVVSILLYGVFGGIAKLVSGSALRLKGGADMAGAFVCALLWSPIVIVPVHFATQGYLTSFSNLMVISLYQVFVNGMTLGIMLWARTRLSPGDES